MGIRVSPEVELGGLDQAEMGVAAYTEETPVALD
jgi:ammonia channel protein AmtB